MEVVICPEKILDARHYDVIVCGGGTAGVFAAVAAARTGAKTALIESKGYVGGIAAEGGCGLHSFYNLWKAFPGVEKKKLVRGIPEEFINRLTVIGGASGHNETLMHYDYDSDALCVDVEKYKYLAFLMLREAGVDVLVNTMLVDAMTSDGRIYGIVTASHQGTECLMAEMYVDATGYGDLSARAGAEYTEPNDHSVANSMGVAGIDIDKYYAFLKDNGALREYAAGPRGGRKNEIIRVDGNWGAIDPKLAQRANDIGMSTVTTTLYDNYLMFIKLNFKMEISPTNRDALAQAEFELRRRQMEAIQLLRESIPGAENAFIARSAPAVTIRRARCITCDYDISNDEIVNAVHFKDDILAYGFHDTAPSNVVKDGGSYGLPYRAILPKKLSNLFAVGMMITSNWYAHMSTRNTVSCMAQGQAAGTAAALCAKAKLDNTRDLPYMTLYETLKKDNVYLETLI